MSLFFVYKSLFSGVFIFDFNNQFTSKDLPFAGTPNMTASVTNDTIIHIFNGGYTTIFFIPWLFQIYTIKYYNWLDLHIIQKCYKCQ